MKNNVVIIGGGAAGMMAAIYAKNDDNDVIILEKNNRLGKKICITGKGRCNITTNLEVEDIIKKIARNPKFMYTALYSYTNKDVINFFEDNGLTTKLERGNRIFPTSDSAKDVVLTLEKVIRSKGIKISLNADVKKINILDYGFEILTKDKKIFANKIIVATGGLSYPSTGSDGYGLKVVEKLGHNIKDTYPVLTSFKVDIKGSGFNESDYKTISGLSLRNVELSIYSGKKKCYNEFGEMLFTHYGISGPIVLTASSVITGKYKYPLTAYIDLKPKLSYEKLDLRILREFENANNKDIINVMKNILPLKLIERVLDKAGIDPRKKVNQITKSERFRLLEKIKKFDLIINSGGDYKEAVVTRGGVDVKEIDSYTMESKLIKNLYFAGEIIDLDAFTGGFNLQIAWSTGYLAGINASF